MTQQAQERTERMRSEAETAAARARDEVNALAAQRDDIARQLDDLSAVIEALGVPEHPVPVGARHGGDPTPTSTTPNSEEP